MIRSAVLTFVLLAVLAPPVAGAGGPVAGTGVGESGVTAPGVGSRFTAIGVRGGTLITKVERRGGGLIASRFVHRRLVVPAVALDNSATGLAADGGTLVLATPRRFPQRRSEFVVFDTQRLRAHGTVTLHGDFTLDAISPDGEMLYLIETTSRRDLSRYAVRAYDLGAGRLVPGAIVDPAEADEPMRGNPVARTLSRDGRWAYTLYDGAGGPHPFIHALDTVRGTAKCIDLDALGRDETYGMVLRIGRGGNVIVRPVDGGAAMLTVDPRSWVVREPRGAAPAPVAARDGGRGWIGPVAGAAILVLLAAAAVWLGRRGLGRRRRPLEHRL
jgi:hypothetical protein